MRVLLASSSSGSRGGGEIFLRYLGQALAQRGHHVTSWCAEHPRMDELAQGLAQVGEVVRFPYRNFYDLKTRIVGTSLNRVTSRRIARHWASLKPDVVHVNKQNLEDGLDLLRAAMFLPMTTVSTIHITQTATFLGAKVAWLRDLLSRRALRAYRGPLVAVQETRRKELNQFLGNGHQTRTIHNGVPLLDLSTRDVIRAAKRTELSIAPEQLLIIGVGRMAEQKRPMTFLETAARLHQRLPQARFLWVGDGTLSNEWDRWVAEQGLGEVIRRLPWQASVRDLLFAADLFLHTAAYEGLPFAIIEAMSAELPCAIPQELASEIKLFTPENVFYFEDWERLARGLVEPSARRLKGQNGRALVASHFSIEKMAAEYERLYQDVGAEVTRL